MPSPAKSDDVTRLSNGTLLLALTGWMDGGDVSTGTIRQLMAERKLSEIGEIDPAGHYIDNFPGSMELAALFRPTVKYVDGMIESFEMPSNRIWLDATANMAFFVGKEPNIDWTGFADTLFDLCEKLDIGRIIFMGSFGGAVPHTREPRLYGSVSDRALLPLLSKFGLKPTEYEGPASFATYLLSRAPSHDLEMLSIAAEIPGYLTGANPLCIEAVTRRLARLLNLPVKLDTLRQESTAWELEVTEAVQKDEDLVKTVRKLEAQYDDELIESG